MQAGADPDLVEADDGSTALHRACEGKDSETAVAVVLALLRAGADVKITDKNERTALFRAAQTQNVQLLGALIGAGGDFDHLDIQGRTPLIHAVKHNNEKAAAYLLEEGADVDVKAYSGKTALIGACLRGNVAMVQLLRRYGKAIYIIANIRSSPQVLGESVALSRR